MRLPLLRARGAVMGQKGLPHSREAPTIGAGNQLGSHIDIRFINNSLPF